MLEGDGFEISERGFSVYDGICGVPVDWWYRVLCSSKSNSLCATLFAECMDCEQRRALCEQGGAPSVWSVVIIGVCALICVVWCSIFVCMIVGEILYDLELCGFGVIIRPCGLLLVDPRCGSRVWVCGVPVRRLIAWF